VRVGLTARDLARLQPARRSRRRSALSPRPEPRSLSTASRIAVPPELWAHPARPSAPPNLPNGRPRRPEYTAVLGHAPSDDLGPPVSLYEERRTAALVKSLPGELPLGKGRRLVEHRGLTRRPTRRFDWETPERFNFGRDVVDAGPRRPAGHDLARGRRARSAAWTSRTSPSSRTGSRTPPGPRHRARRPGDGPPRQGAGVARVLTGLLKLGAIAIPCAPQLGRAT
jgi:hypothetical protein